MPEVEWSPDFVPGDRTVRRRRSLTGGFASPVWLCDLDDGQQVVVKASSRDSAELFAAEAEGLEVLAELGGLRTPRVIAVGPRSIVLEALDLELPQTDEFWRSAGHHAARMHSSTSHDLFGWERDGWLGLLPQRNPWTSDGHRFFAENRVLRYLGEPRVEAALDAADRSGIERMCARLPELVPDTGACLTHGDMWRNNVIADSTGQPAFLDPAVSYTWAEIDVAHMLCSGGVPECFFDAYAEVRPLHGDWREHARILNLRQLLAMLASGIPIPSIVPTICELIRVYA
ncbi:phosphotransferase [Planctomonas sp. JC2975]|uniref:fructosamine kinase family protein n=1 Tax=Planctomonas sp. JC2975 TaxID=2729626 RepID=UPI0014766A62|nr:phosphotransferase [Planctomonas sp. JC2975]